MPRVSAVAGLLEGVKVTTIDGDAFIRLRDASKVSSVHPVVLEMGQKLLKSIGGTGASFELGTREMQAKAAEIDKTIRLGLKRVAKLFEPNRQVKVKSARDGNRLVFWYSA